jgi:aryl carrier-like protein
MNKPQTDAALALLDDLKAQAERILEAGYDIRTAIEDAEANLLDDEVDPAADRRDLIGDALDQIDAYAMEAEGASLDIRELLDD